MTQPTIINKFGKLTGWNSITVNFWGRDIEGIVELEYGDEVDKANEYGQGGYPQGQSEGNYKPTPCSLTLFSEEIVAMQKSVPSGLRLQDAPPTTIVVQYEINGVILKDKIENTSIMSVGKSVKQGDGKITHKMMLLNSHVNWNV